LEQRGFSAAARTGNGQEFALEHSKIYTAQGMDPAILEFFLQSDDLEYISRRGGRNSIQNHWLHGQF
jgi:hypothetical protein